MSPTADDWKGVERLISEGNLFGSIMILLTGTSSELFSVTREWGGGHCF